jgi:hypothetical protein
MVAADSNTDSWSTADNYFTTWLGDSFAWRESRTNMNGLRTMTIKEIEKQLPNGFHDSKLKRVAINYEKREIELLFDVFVERRQDEHTGGVRFREGTLKAFGLFSCVIEPPDPNYLCQLGMGLWVADSGEIAEGNCPIKLSYALPKSAFGHYFYINDWNAFIYLIASEARFEWQ